jgi:hypothetical protein
VLDDSLLDMNGVEAAAKLGWQFGGHTKIVAL